MGRQDSIPQHDSAKRIAAKEDLDSRWRQAKVNRQAVFSGRLIGENKSL